MMMNWIKPVLAQDKPRLFETLTQGLSTYKYRHKEHSSKSKGRSNHLPQVESYFTSKEPVFLTVYPNSKISISWDGVMSSSTPQPTSPLSVNNGLPPSQTYSSSDIATPQSYQAPDNKRPRQRINRACDACRKMKVSPPLVLTEMLWPVRLINYTLIYCLDQVYLASCCALWVL